MSSCIIIIMITIIMTTMMMMIIWHITTPGGTMSETINIYNPKKKRTNTTR